MEGERAGLKPRPGLKVAVTVGGRRTEGQLLHPERPGYPDGAWVVVFDDGMADAFGLEEMETAE
jgi:hypothetical protein